MLVFVNVRILKLIKFLKSAWNFIHFKIFDFLHPIKLEQFNNSLKNIAILFC